MTEILIKRLSKNINLPKYETEVLRNGSISKYKFTYQNWARGNFNNSNRDIGLDTKNFEIQIRPRSGLAAKNQISVLNTPGTIDADYRGEIKVILINLSKSVRVEKGQNSSNGVSPEKS